MNHLRVRNAECGVRSEGPGQKPGPSSLFHRPSAGFTLLEVMVAVAILAMVLVTLLGVKNRSMQDVMLADHMTTATLLAKRIMTETLATRTTGTIGQTEDEGEFTEEEFKDYAWKKSISLLQPMEDVSIIEVRVAVLWKEGERQESVELVSLL